jgi:hypothetical protein
MSAYFQMGNDTENLVGEEDLIAYSGIILSPVNREPAKFTPDIINFRQSEDLSPTGKYDIILDSQMYVPRSNRGCLAKHDYFPSDLDTSDLTSIKWWENVCYNLAEYVKKLDINGVTSPAFIPNTYRDDYYALCNETYRSLKEDLRGENLQTLYTLLINFNEIGELDAAMNLASIVSGANPDGYYLVIMSDMEPRRELIGEHQLAGIMELIDVLERTGKPVLVSHCSSEMILYKAAGASHCATGKFFNLRRFTKSRYEEPSSGGGQLEYWFEQSLLAFIRTADIARLKKKGLSNLLEHGYSNNLWSQKILNHFQTKPGVAWLAFGWRQYLSWFGKCERSLTHQDAIQSVEEMLIMAENNWRILAENRVLFDEMANDGSWIRNWRQALIEYTDRTNKPYF